VNHPTATAGMPEHHRSGFPEWLYLFFLVFLFLGPAFDPTATTADWVTAAVTVAISGAIYLIGMSHRAVSRWAAVALLVVGVASTSLGTAAMGVVPIYAAALAACFVSRRVLTQRLTVISLVTLASMLISPIPSPYLFLVFAPALPLIWLIGYSVHEDNNRSREAHSLRAENARIQYLATVTERERIARDLHDLAGQALTAVALRSQLVQRLAASNPDRVREEAAAIEATARETLASLRETVAGWQQVDLRDELDKGLKALEVAGVDGGAEGHWAQDLAPSVETVLAVALREAVTNVVRHAQARTCRILLDSSPGEIALVVEDDGVGLHAPEGSGLRGMRERVLAAGGTVELADGGRTALRVTIPVGGG
jgi:two-component system sensor histidine kinase DesK